MWEELGNSATEAYVSSSKSTLIWLLIAIKKHGSLH